MWESYVKETNDGWRAYVMDGDKILYVYAPFSISVYDHADVPDSTGYLFKFNAVRDARRAAKRLNIRDYAQMEKV